MKKFTPFVLVCLAIFATVYFSMTTFDIVIAIGAVMIVISLYIMYSIMIADAVKQDAP